MKTALAIVFVIILIAVGYFAYTRGKSSNPNSIATDISNVTQDLGVKNNNTPAPTSEIPLTITSPTDGATLSSTNLKVTGHTSPNADVFVDDVTGKADANGNFSISIGIDEGQNTISVAANDANGNATQKEITVTVSSFE